MAEMYFIGKDIRKSRLPSSKYDGSNGFLLPQGPESSSSSESSLKKPDYAALDAHRTAQYVLTQKDRPIPTLAQMEAELKPDTKESLLKRIEDLREQHLSDLQRMYVWHAEEYLDDAHDMYLSLDEPYYPNGTDFHDDNNPDTRDEFEQFYHESHRYIPQHMRWNNELEDLQHSHFQLLLPLYQELKQLEEREEEERKRREADFPASIEEYRTKSEEVKMRVARFLMMSQESQQEKMLSEFGWAWRQVKPLQEEFKKNDAFKSELIVKMMEIKDPRLRGF
ncbi:hypothetical protein H0H93_000659 [Arthromyces matolae]|nr:hypothetical protein H0H93_000659 [Arthromyces matolae]